MAFATWVEVDLDRLDANLHRLQDHVGSECDLLLVVKADAYGHGALEVARTAQLQGVRHFGVATLHEGIQLRVGGLRSNVWVLSPLLESEIPEAVAYRLEPTLPSLSFARKLSEASLRAGRATRVHVEVDTGMGRTGIDPGEAVGFLREVGTLVGLRLGSVYTHFPEADSDDPAFTREQWRRFHELLDELASQGIHPPFVHAANSAAALRFPEMFGNLIRPGLAAFGLHPPNTPDLGLEPTMSLKSRLVQVRGLPKGRTISYGRTRRLERDSVIGVVPVGYGHGYSWLASNRGSMLVSGKPAPIVGRVTMDLTMVDLTDHPPVEPGEEVVLFGKQGESEISVEEVAGWSETLPYEVLCTIGKRVSRVYLREQRAWKVLTLVGERQKNGFESISSENRQVAGS